jgi:Uma2 family endonuclease
MERRTARNAGVSLMSTITRGLTVDQYDQMVKDGILPETNRLELIEGRIVEKDVKDPEHSTVVELTRGAIARVLPKGWVTRQEQPVRIPNRKSEPEPDISVVRGTLKDYAKRHPGPEDVALIVEVTRSSVAKDRALAHTYGGGGIPAYWIVNVEKQRLEVYEGPVEGKYPSPRILSKKDSVPLIIDGRDVGQTAVATLFP